MDKERLLRRTQTKRSAYRVLGKPEPVPEPVAETLPGEPVRTRDARLENSLWEGSYMNSLQNELFL